MTTCYCTGACRETGVCPNARPGQWTTPLMPPHALGDYEKLVQAKIAKKPPSREETIQACIKVAYEMMQNTRYEGVEKLAVATFCIELQQRLIRLMAES